MKTFLAVIIIGIGIIIGLFQIFLWGCEQSTNKFCIEINRIDDEINNEFIKFENKISDEFNKLFNNGKKDLLQKQLNFENNLKCQEKGDIIKSTFKDILSAYYNTEANTCYVKYYANNTIKEMSLDGAYILKGYMEKTKKTTQYNTQGISQSQATNNNPQTNNAFCKVRSEQYDEAMWEYRYCLKEKESNTNGFTMCLKPIKPSCY